MDRWLFQPGTPSDDSGWRKASPRLLTQYFNALGLVGTAYLQCFSGMRIGEAMSLRSNCLSVEHDLLLGDIHILSGETTKTTQDDEARWLAAPTVSLAVEAMSTIARWRSRISTASWPATGPPGVSCDAGVIAPDADLAVFAPICRALNDVIRPTPGESLRGWAFARSGSTPGSNPRGKSSRFSGLQSTALPDPMLSLIHISEPTRPY